MRFNPSVTAIILCILASCSNKNETTTPGTPEALQESAAETYFPRARSQGNMVDRLYQELFTKQIALKQLEDQINALEESRSDSANTFDLFHQKNQSYFNDANKYVKAIKDSALRDKIRDLLAAQLTKYTASVAGHQAMLETAHKNSLVIEDLHLALKIVKTLPLMNQYQQDNFPATKPIEGFIKQQRKTINQLDSLIKK